MIFPRGGARENKVDQYVLGCQISMDHHMLVQMCQAVQALQAQRLGKPCGLVAAAADGAANELVQVAICQRNANTVLAQMACMLMMSQKPCPQPSKSVHGKTTNNNMVGRPHLTLCSVRQLNNNTINAMRCDVQIAQTMMQQ